MIPLAQTFIRVTLLSLGLSLAAGNSVAVEGQISQANLDAISAVIQKQVDMPWDS